MEQHAPLKLGFLVFLLLFMLCNQPLDLLIMVKLEFVLEDVCFG